MNRKKCFFVLVLFETVFLSFAAKNTAKDANRRTAIRCLKLAETYISTKDWGNALSQAELGIVYDDSISDLWFIQAAAKSGLGEARCDVLPLVKHSLEEGEWVDYNKDGARILYADILCETGNPEKALEILDEKPFIYSADAEFIRVKAFYRSGNDKAAREKVNSARKIYSSDLRFPLVFFRNEYRISKGNVDFVLDADQAALVRKIADSFIAKMPEYDNPDDELEIYAAIFSDNEHQKRLLQAFTAHGMKHPLYAAAALKTELMNEQEAWDYFCSFADSEVSIENLEDILVCITDDVTKESVKEHLDAYEGKLSIDTDNDGEPNLFAQYVRGRPQSVYWDKNNDGIIEWSCECDFGVPLSIVKSRLDVDEESGKSIAVTYGTYPAVIKVSEGGERNSFYDLQDETYFWTPLDIKVLEIAKKDFGCDFFVPYPSEEQLEIDENEVRKCCTFYETSSSERNGGRIKFSVVDGKMQGADYFDSTGLYAHCVFEDGYPSVRSIDNDGDGNFETLELYAVDSDGVFIQSDKEAERISENLFGDSSKSYGIYLKMVQIDRNSDTVPDWTEEYVSNGGRISSWDIDGDGNWDIRYKKYPLTEDGTLLEDALFHIGPENKTVSVTIMNNEPAKVYIGEDEEYPVTPGIDKSFYWLGEAGSAEDEAFAKSGFDSLDEQGVSHIVSDGEKTISVIRIGDKVYATLIPALTRDEKSEDNTENQNDYENAEESSEN